MAPSADSLIEHFSQVPDPRIERSQRHRLIDIVVIDREWRDLRGRYLGAYR